MQFPIYTDRISHISMLPKVFECLETRASAREMIFYSQANATDFHNDMKGFH